MKLGEMNWPDVAALDRQAMVAVYPIASFEQHGHHLPFLTDTIETTGVVDRLDMRLAERVLCLPTQWLGYSFHHMRFAGSLTATSETHIRMIVETVDGLVRAGFLRVLIVNGHGGNQANLKVAQQILKEKHDGACVLGASWWELAKEALDQVKEAGPTGSGHAGEMETSLMMALRPDLVRTDRLLDDGWLPTSVHGARVQRFGRIDEQTERGVYGSPTAGSADKGERMLRIVVDSLVEVVEDMLADRF